MKRRVIAMILLIVLVLGSLSGCGGKQEETPEPTPDKSESQAQPSQQEPEKEPEPAGNLKKTTTSKEENALRIASASPSTLDQMYCIGAFENDICQVLYDTLLKRDENNEWQPWIATEMEPNEDGTETIMTIRDDVYFHSGDKMTAEDILYSYEHSRTSVGLSNLCAFSTLEIIDDTHLKWTFPEEGVNYYSMIDTLGSLTVYNKSFCETISNDPSTNFGLEVDATGPYYLVGVEAGTGNTTLKKFDKYWNDHGYIDTLCFINFTGDKVMAFESGSLDFAPCSESELRTMEKYDNVNPQTSLSGINMLVCNCATVFADPKLREVVQYSFDREDVGMATCDYSGLVAYNIVEANCPLWEDCAPHRDLDADKARSMMSELGYSQDDPCKIRLVTLNGDPWIAAAQVLKENLEECYFAVDISVSDDAMEIILGDFDLAFMGFVMQGNFGYYNMLFDIESGLDIAFYEEPDAADIAYLIQTATDEESARKAMLAMDGTYAYIPLAYPGRLYVFDADLEIPAIAGGLYDYAQMKWK